MDGPARTVTAAARGRRVLGGNELDELISAVLRHYEALYVEHSRAAEIDPYQFLVPTWLSSLEKTFLWMGGWKPGVAFHLVK